MLGDRVCSVSSSQAHSGHTESRGATRPVVRAADLLRCCSAGGGGLSTLEGRVVSDAAPHRLSGGSLDESARRLSHEELHVARALAAEGHTVRSLPDGRGRGRTADLEVCGVPVEVKSWLSLGERHGVAPGPRSVVNKLISAEGQSGLVVLVANGSGLSASAATTGVARYAALRPSSSIRTVRVLGDGFDLSWTWQPRVELGRSRHRAPGIGIGT